jgi:hypothetical protein
MKEEFLGIDYLGSKPQLAIGKTLEHDVENIDPIVHLVIDKEETEMFNKSRRRN